MKKHVSVILMLAGLVIGTPAAAQTTSSGYPDRSIRLVVTGTPGQGTDVLSRLIAEKISDRVGKSVVVDNRPGAGGNIGADTVAKAPADGYTLLMATNATHAANPAMYSNIPFDPLKDFTPVAMVGLLPMMLSATPSLPADTVSQLIDAALKRPGDLNVAVPSTSARVMLQLFNQLAKVDLYPVPYKGSGAAYTDMFGGRVQLIFDTVSGSLAHVNSGKLKPLAITTSQRFDAVPMVPTFAESGLPEFNLAPWNALVAPQGTPDEIVQFLNKHVVAVLSDPELRKKMASMGIQPQPGTPAQLNDFIHAEAEKWGDLVREAKIIVN